VSASPTPWRLDEDGDIIAANQVLVAIIPAKEDRALMVAAPDLLQFAKQVVEFAHDNNSPYLAGWAQAVVNKAEGKS
jgi:hypothetical protein